ncbi:MAG TPA: c-type cytochrome, partial [Pseudohaliea sp.]|nr:c-type cytochrome [Pseudohaliea sp.]
AGLGERYLYEQLVAIRDGERVIAQMAGQVDNKTDQELADLAAYYDSFERSGGQADPELAELGEKVYRAGVAERNVAACTSCHSPHGEGNGPAGFPALAGQHAEYIEAQLKAYRLGYERPGEGRYTDGDAKIMRSNAFGLTDYEIRAVASYIAGLQ